MVHLSLFVNIDIKIIQYILSSCIIRKERQENVFIHVTYHTQRPTNIIEKIIHVKKKKKSRIFMGDNPS